MKLFTARLSDDHRARLELIRAHLGCRSEADAVRSLIEMFELKPAPIPKPPVRTPPFQSPTVAKVEASFGRPRAAPGSRLKTR